MTVRTLGLIFISLSAAWVHCVSAGGAYCAKTARARAAALGLDYPGVHGAPNLSGPSSHSTQHPQAPHHQRSQNNPPAVNYNPFYHPPQEFPHFKPAGSRTRNLVQSNLLSSLSRGEPQNNRQSNFEQVKRVGPLTEKQPPGRDDLVQGASESHKIPLPFVYNWPGVAVDSSVLNRHGVRGVSGLPQPSPGFGVYYVVYPVGAGSKPSVVYPMATKGSLHGHAAWTKYGRLNMEPRHPYYHLGKRE